MTIFNLFITILIATSIVAITNPMPRTIKFGLTISLLTTMIYMGTGTAHAIGYNEYGEIVTNGYLNGFEDNNTTVIDGVTYVTPSKIRGYEPPEVIVMPPIGGYIYPPIFQPYQRYNRW